MTYYYTNYMNSKRMLEEYFILYPILYVIRPITYLGTYIKKCVI